MGERAARVLVVDDERFFREAIRDALAAASIGCELATGAEEAVKAAEDPQVAAVVLDIGLAGLPGGEDLELLRRLQTGRPDLRVIALSASSDQERVLDALRQGACDYLAKPLHEEELVLAVRRALAGQALEAGLVSLRGRLSRLRQRMADLADWLPEPGAGWEPIGERVAAGIGDVLSATRTSMILLEPDGERLRVVGSLGSGLAPAQMDPVAVGEGVAGRAVERGLPVVPGDVAGDARFAGRAPGDRYRTRSFVVAPFEGAGVMGALCATDRDDGSDFDDDDLSLLSLLALQLGALLSNRPAQARAEAPEPPPEPSRGAEVTQPLASEPAEGDPEAEMARLICEAVTTEIEPERLLDAALRPIGRMVPAEPVALYLIDPASGELAREAQVRGSGAGDRPRLSRSRGLTATVLQTGRLVATDHPETDPRFDPEADTPEGGAVGPFLCAPLRLRGKVMGVVRVFPGAGSSASARSGEILSAALSAAVRNVLLYRSLLESIDEVAHARVRPRGSG